MPTSSQVKLFDPKVIVDWFQSHARDFPWRRNPTFYYVWLAEIMSQQTQMGQLLPFFNKFITRLPSAEALAEAPLEIVLELWAGLGYYSRARSLHETARNLCIAGLCREPQSYDELVALKGIGPYTAGAIASQVWGEKQPAFDGNVRRVFARLLGERGIDIYERTFQNKVEDAIRVLLADVSAGAFNQAVMELGATVCTKSKPACERCPISNDCVAFKNKIVSQVPAAKPRAQSVSLEVDLVVVRDGDRIFLSERLRGQWYQGLYDVLNSLGGSKQPVQRIESFADWESQNSMRFLGLIKHAITKHKIVGRVWVKDLDAVHSFASDGLWVDAAELHGSLLEDFQSATRVTIPLATTAKKALRLYFSNKNLNKKDVYAFRKPTQMSL